ncbi:hypothetical protein [Pedobacter foliorum]|uniref:hypothetical protein n=1 Tax=Pedobacter foliorum TaxID=2739058 RepID=UPI0015641713|nr:hypothetical protein [Pedobacter foliorum]NRF37511.1 hypothetical protein [Pedobacter foliorum]
MGSIVTKTISQLAIKPRKLFMIDSFGAILTAFFLFVVLRNFDEYFGMPKSVLTYLSITGTLFFIYSASCFFFLKSHWTPFIIAVSIANLLYSILTMGLLIIYSPMLTVVGITYFLMEIAIVCGLAYIELNVAIAIKQNRIDNNR